MRQRLKNRHLVLWLRRRPLDDYVARIVAALIYIVGHAAAAPMALWLLATPAQAQQLRTLPSHVPWAAAHLQPIDRVPGLTRLNLAIGLPLRNQETLTKLLQQIYDPASPQYRHYLTPEQFTEMFGPTEQDYQSVIAFARTNGFTVTGLHPNRLLLDVNATVADIEKAFHVKMCVYQHPTEARRFFAPDVKPSVGVDLPVLDVNGLSDYTRPHPANLKLAPHQATTRARPADGSGASGTYMGYDFRAAYAPGVALTGTGQTIGLVQFDGYYPGDITAYESNAGLPSVTLTNVYIDGFDGTPVDTDGNIEVSLDIEMVISMAPGLAKVILYEAPTNGIPNDILNRMATDNQARELSCSWGWGGGPDTNADQIFQEMALQGQSFFAASGDSDAYYTSTSTNFPADDPYLTSVGGTTLTTTGPLGPYVSETVWNWGVEYGQDGMGSSGGISTSYPMPTWQQGIATGANGGSTSMRNIPDVALTADNVDVIAGNGTDYGNQGGIGGTSCAAPLWAAFVALVNEQAGTNGPVGFINPAIYLIGTELDYASDFQDITTGNNEWLASPTQFTAVPGYDLCTGWGTPAGSNLINALSRPLDGLRIRPVTGFTASGPTGGPFNVTSQNYALSNAGTTTLNWSVLNTPAWLSVSPSSGTLTSGGTPKTVTVSLNPAATNLAAGTYSGYVQFANLNSGATLNRQFTLQIGQPLVQNGDFETGDFSFWTLTGDASGNSSLVDDGSITGVTPYDGNYCADLSEFGSVADLTQTLPTQAGMHYLLSFWLANVDVFGFGTSPNEFLVSWNGNTLSSQFNQPAYDWTYVQFVVVATTNNTVLQFGFRNDQFFFGLDDVSVTPLPEPVFQSVTRTTNNIELTWSTVPGMVYQVQYTANLHPTTWSNLDGTITATGNTLSTSYPIGTATRRFYRAVLLP
ncbi:MAG TPA: protease pro-enzyme activation domain-containing protein [Verrucomicrobiae bacterium]|nr:protease pro-enzyme activation domain-containing protein [Verrucomicrobiae bacterium]